MTSLGAEAEIVWHTRRELDGFNAVIVPGGFAHGDHIRPGAIAQFSPVMGAVATAAAEGYPVLGICNGFQVLVETGLLPGALMRNDGLRFLCETVTCEVVSTSSVLTSGSTPGARLALPINHYEGNYTCDEETLAQLIENGQVVLRYSDNPNGSTGSVAGVRNLAGQRRRPHAASRAGDGSTRSAPRTDGDCSAPSSTQRRSLAPARFEAA